MFKFIIIKIFFLFYFSIVSAEVIKKIEIEGNDRIPDETIVMFSKVKINDDINQNDINKILKEIYETNYFEDVIVDFNNQILKITVDEFPIIQNLNYEGIKAKRIGDVAFKNLSLRNRSSYNEIFLNEDKKKINNSLKTLGYYFSKIEVFVEELDNNNTGQQLYLQELLRVKREREAAGLNNCQTNFIERNVNLAGDKDLLAERQQAIREEKDERIKEAQLRK